MLDKLKGATIFSKMDMLSYYWQISVCEGNEKKLAFWTNFRMFEPVMMPFGVKRGPAVVQQLSNKLFAEMNFVLVYLDNVLVFSKSEEEHLRHLR